MKRRLLVAFYAVLSMALIRCSTDDIDLPEGLTSTPATISHLRKVQLTDGLKFGPTSIRGIITSDKESGNIDDNFIVVQEEGRDAAILVELSQPNTLDLHTEVLLNLEGSTLLEENGELRIKNINAAQVTPTGRTLSITPKSTSLSSVTAEARYWGPVLVRLENLSLTGTGELMNGLVTLSDGITELHTLFRNSSTFSTEELPEVAQTFIGVVRVEGDRIYVNPRNLDDVQAQANELIEDFEAVSSTNYDVKSLNFKTGSWIVDGGITASTSADLKTGAQSIRLQGSTTNENRKGILAMEFDLQGVKNLRVSHGIYPAGAETSNVNPTTIDVEMSKDGGATYTLLKQLTVDIKSTVLITDQVEVNAAKTENVRIRIVNSSLPFANNNRPRINIDDIVFEY